MPQVLSLGNLNLIQDKNVPRNNPPKNLINSWAYHTMVNRFTMKNVDGLQIIIKINHTKNQQ
jgi:hypothetical protein